MADVARIADVSVPTVSRVLSGTHRVSEAKTERVRAAIEQLGFRRSGAARALALGRSNTIAVIAGNTARYGYAETIRGIEEAARREGFTVMITVVESDDESEVNRATTAVLSQSIAGVVVLRFDRAGVEALRRIPADVPVVALSGVREPGGAQAVIDEMPAAQELIAHLLNLGHSTVHHVRIPPSRTEDGRTVGWRRALKRANREIPEIIDATWDPRSGRDIGQSLALRPDITAVFCGNDEIAMGVIRGLNDAGLHVPQDVSVVGFDDHPLSELWAPALTTVRQDFADLGRRGFRQLSDTMAGNPAKHLSAVRPHVVIRDSAAPPSK